MALVKREEVKEKELIAPNQTGFRKGVGAINNIHIYAKLFHKQTDWEKGRENNGNI